MLNTSPIIIENKDKTLFLKELEATLNATEVNTKVVRLSSIHYSASADKYSVLVIIEG